MWVSMLVLILLVVKLTWASPLDQDRLFDRVWTAYLPKLHTHFTAYLALDDATLDALSAAPRTSVHLLIRLNRHGGVQTVEVRAPSVLPAFTHACVDAAQRMGQLPDLPRIVHDRGRREGLDFVFGTQ